MGPWPTHNDHTASFCSLRLLKVAAQIAGVISRLALMSTGVDSEFPFTVVVDDPSGNSFVENPSAPNKDPALKVCYFPFYFRQPRVDRRRPFPHRQEERRITAVALIPPPPPFSPSRPVSCLDFVPPWFIVHCICDSNAALHLLDNNESLETIPTPMTIYQQRQFRRRNQQHYGRRRTTPARPSKTCLWVCNLPRRR